MWCKSCPDCGGIQSYSSKRAYDNAVRLNRRCLYCKNGGKNNPFFGKHHSKKHREYLSKAQRKCSFRYKQIGKNPKKTKKTCAFCGTTFFVIRSQSNRKYHTYECAIKDNFGFSWNKKTRPELDFEFWLKKNKIKYKSPFHLKGKLYDFYIPHKNMLIEIDGIYWHAKGVPDRQLNEIQKANKENDNIKNRLAKENGYTIMRIWEDEITHVSEHFYK